MLSQTKKKILSFLEQNPDSSVVRIVQYLGITKQATSVHLAELMKLGLISKKGRPPKVFYSISTQSTPDNEARYDLVGENVIEQNFAVINPEGSISIGREAFVNWCLKRDFDPVSKSKEYIQVVEKYNSYKNSLGLIDATQKVVSTYGEQIYLNALYYTEFSAYEIFGKTKIYAQLLYAKQSQDFKLVTEIVREIKDKLLTLIIQQKIDAVGFIPPTVPRKVQFQKEVEKLLALPLPVIKITKIQTDIIIPQKSLSSTEERIINSKSTFVVEETRGYENILLIDDFVGSAATLNFVAEKYIRKFPKTKKIIGFAIAGTPNGVVNNSKKFEVVSEA